MSVSLEPSSQLAFQRPFTQLVKQVLRVTNPNSQPVAFKVKTTAPKQYCVRPNSGRIEPGESVEVQVLLQPMKEDPPTSTKCKDKFLVQSTFISASRENLSLNDIWNVSADKGTQVNQQKLKVVYLAAEGVLPEEDEGEVGNASMLTEADSKYETVRPQLNGHNEPPIPVFDRLPPTPPPAVSQTPPPRAHTPLKDIIPLPPAPVAAPVPVTAPAPATTENSDAAVAAYAAKLAEARAEISRLQTLLASATELRRRKAAHSEDGASTLAADHDEGASVVENVAPDGVPLNVVAILSFLVFLVTYLFF